MVNSITQQKLNYAQQNFAAVSSRLCAFEQGNRWRGAKAAGQTPDVSTHNSLVADFQSAQEELRNSETIFKAAKGTTKTQKSMNPENSEQKLNLVG